MPDWQDLVRRKLAGLALDSFEKKEVHAELVAHLEESYEGFRRKGLPEQEAFHETLAQVPDWHDLRQQIFLAKQGGDNMQKRMRQLWIPGFLTLILSVFFLMTLQKLGFQARIVWSGPNTILLYVPWLLSLPFFGGLGAYVSARAGGSRGTVLLASVFPVVALTGAFLLMFPIGVVIEWIIRRQVGFGGFGIVATVILRDGIGWLLVPGVALLGGGLLLEFLVSRGLGSRRIVIN